MTQSNVPAESLGAVLIVDGDILSRHAIADYLRHCGYKVVEAVSTDEAMTALGDPKIGTQTGFELANWVRQNHPELEVRIAGSLAGAVDTAADLCESGPHLARPYEPQAVVDYIKQLRAARDRD
jgi:CheY-like chemotaxis protein